MTPRPLKSLAFHFTPCAHKSSYVYGRLARLTGVFKNHAGLVLYIIGSELKDIMLYV